MPFDNIDSVASTGKIIVDEGAVIKPGKTGEAADGKINAAFTVGRRTAEGKNYADFAEVPEEPADGYLPAGTLLYNGGESARTKTNIVLTVATSNAAVSNNVMIIGNPGGTHEKNKPLVADKFKVAIHNSTANDAADHDTFVAAKSEMVNDAEVFAGPFMSVKLRSSSTKMVIGAVCVTGKETSETAFYMDNVSKVVTASDASIYIEGGFGKLTLQTGDYAGGVSKIGDAGDAADIDAGGLVAIVEGVGLLGANPYLAVDLAKNDSLNSLEVLTGGTIDMGGLTAAVDVKLKNTSEEVGIESWDLGLGYSMGDADVDFVIDSANAWGMKASMAVAGFAVDATIYNKATAAHKKNGLFYSVSASTDLNGFGLSLGVDQDMKPTVGLSYDVGSMNIYAGYDAADKGGKVGAKLSF
jgi:hypothetical protein